MTAFPYTITISLPDFASMNVAGHLVFPNGDFGGLSIGLFVVDDPSPVLFLDTGNPQLSSTPIGGGINLGKIKFSGAGFSYVSSGTKIEIGGSYTVSFNVTISAGLLTIVIQEISSSSPSHTLPLRIASITSIVFLQIAAENTGSWASQSFNAVAGVTGGNSPTITKSSTAWNTNGPATTLDNTVYWNLSDISRTAIPSIPTDPTNAQRYGIILRGDTGIWRVTAINGGIMSLTPYELPQHNIRETAAL